MKSDTSDLSFLFSIAPFQAKGKEGNEDDGLKLMTDTQDPSFLLSWQIVLIVLWGYGFVSNDTIGEIEPRPFCSSMVTTRTDGVASGEHQVYLNVIPSHDFWRRSKVDIEPEGKCTVLKPRQSQSPVISSCLHLLCLVRNRSKCRVNECKRRNRHLKPNLSYWTIVFGYNPQVCFLVSFWEQFYYQT